MPALNRLIPNAWADFLLTTQDRDTARLKVTGQSEQELAFEEGRGFRFDYNIDMAQGADPLYFKFVIDAPINLTLSSIELAEGGIHYEVFSSLEASELTAFNTTLNRTFSKNPRVPNTPEMTVYTGGTITELDDASTNVYVRTASGGGNRSSAVAAETSKRGFPATTAFTKISILDGVNTGVKGTYKLEWEVV